MRWSAAPRLIDIQGSQALIIHASMFMQLLAAQHAGKEELARFYAERFPPDVKKAYECMARAEALRESRRRRASLCAESLPGPRRRRSGRSQGRRDEADGRRRAHRAIAPANISPIPCSLPPCSSLPARPGNLNSRACVFPPRSSLWRCSLLPSSECSSCPQPNDLQA